MEAKAGSCMGVALDRAHDDAAEGDPAVVAGKLARLERWGAAAGDGRVEEEDGEDGRDGERDDQPHRAALAGHEPEFTGGFPPL
jgi:hypothetical protein